MIREAPPDAMNRKLRAVTLNIHKGLSQFNRRMVLHELREGLRALEPDIVFLQEVQGLNQRHALRFASWTGAAQHEFLAGGRWEHAYGRNAVYEHGHHGNAILSRFPILSAENQDVSDHRFERRGLLHTVVTVPGWRRNLHCVCVHLSLHERGRRRQLDAIAARLEELAAKDLPLVVAGDFRAQTKQVFENLKAALAAAGATFDNVVKTNTYVTDLTEIQALREIRASYYGRNVPASTLVRVGGLARPDLMIEIEAIAVVPE